MTSTLEDDLKPLIWNKRWDAVVERLATENEISEESGIIFIKVVECIREACCQKGLPLYVLDAFLKVCPKGTRDVESHSRNLLLHNALENDQSAEIINLLIEKYPEGSRVQNCFEMLPIHNAAIWSTCPGVISRLIESYPEGAQQTDDDESLPIHYAAFKSSVENVDRLIDAYPDGVRKTDKLGMLPIHNAAKYCKSLEVLNRFIEVYPEGVQQPDKKYGWLPIHRAVIDRDCARSPVALEIIKHLIEAYPEGLQKRDKRGQLPIHLAAHYHKSVDVIKVLIDAYPMSIIATSPEGLLHLMPSEHAIVGDHSDEVVSYLENEEKKFFVDLAHVVVGRRNGGDE